MAERRGPWAQALLDWHRDVQEFGVDDQDSPPAEESMWDAWNFGQTPASGNILDEEPWWERCEGLPLWRSPFICPRPG